MFRELLHGGFWLLLALVILAAWSLVVILGSLQSQNHNHQADAREPLSTTKAMSDSEDRFRHFFQVSPDGIIVTRLADGLILDQNRNMAAMSGYSDEECIGHSLQEDGLRMWVHPEDREWLLSEVRAKGRGSLEALFRRKDGTQGMGILSSVPIEIDGEACLLSVLRDITETRRMEQALKASESRLRTLIDTIPDLVWMKDTEGVFLECNRRFEQLLGVGRENLIGKTDYYFLNSRLADSFRENDRKAIAAGKPTLNEEEVWFLDDGHREDLETIKTPILGADGTLLGILGIGRDITQRKRAERSALENERLLRKLFEGSPIGMIQTTPEGLLLEANLALATMCGYEDPSSMIAEVNWHGVEEFSCEGHSPLSDSMRKLRDHPGTWVVDEICCRRRDGMPLYAISSLISYQGPELGGHKIFGFIQDITERKRSEQEIRDLKTYLASIIDSMPSVVVGLDLEAHVVQWNRHAEVTTGISAKDACGKTLTEVLPGFSAWIESMLAEVRDLRQPVSMERQLRMKACERTYYDLMLYPLIANGAQGAVLKIEDVTERTRIHELMIQTEKMLSVGGLVAGMTHEINNPLGIISQAAQNIERRLVSDLPSNRAVAEEIGLDLTHLKAYFDRRQIPEFISSIQDAVVRTNKIVGSMLQFSRKPDSTKFPASLPDLVQEALDLAANDYDLRKKFDFKNIEVHREIEPDLPKVLVAPIEIEQVVLNLLKNAAQAMADNPPVRPPRIDLRIRRDSPHLVLEVEDNGPGMSDSVCRRIFEPFFTTKEPGAGTGLGLSVSYTIITQNHQGTFEVDSVPNKGSRFTVRLPFNEKNNHAQTCHFGGVS